MASASPICAHPQGLVQRGLVKLVDLGLMVGGLHWADEGIMLADMSMPRPMYQAFAMQVGRFDRLFAHSETLTLMVKIRDEIGGRIAPRWVNKSLQVGDKSRLQQGVKLARAILSEAGAKRVFQCWHFAAHPGGSVRIGEGVTTTCKARPKTCTFAMRR